MFTAIPSYKPMAVHDNMKRIQSTTWGFPSDITTSDASVAIATTKPANPYPDPSSMTVLDLKIVERGAYKLIMCMHTRALNQLGTIQDGAQVELLKLHSSQRWDIVLIYLNISACDKQ